MGDIDLDKDSENKPFIEKWQFTITIEDANPPIKAKANASLVIRNKMSQYMKYPKKDFD